ncbi:MAG TPA: LPS export ABC transporter periplasmic protein LptC, partial [Geobacteraceae bacterium]|nr:LPS export ABC transporter periplasmic protein LptC [Geobacteraceae bacterium]
MLKPNKIKLLLALSVILAGVGLTVTIILKTHQSTGPVQILKQLPKNVDISLQKIHYTDTKDGQKRWDLIAEKVEYDKIRDLTLFSAIRMEIFSRGKGDGKLTLRAEKAIYDNKTGDVEAEGNVTVVNEAGMKFETERLRYESSSSKIDTRDFVKITDGKLTVEGTEMVFMLKEKSVRILHD